MSALLALGSWYSVRDGDPRLVALYSRHYSARVGVTRATWRQWGMSGPGESMCLLTADGLAGFIWQISKIRRDEQSGVNCSFFRNESKALASDLVREACDLAWARWPGERLWTYVDPGRVAHQGRKRPAGYCFIAAGWTPCGTSKGGLSILELPAHPGAGPQVLEVPDAR